MKSGAKYEIFVYGTLKNPETFSIVTGKELKGQPAYLHGYSLISRPSSFPYLIEKEDGIVKGLYIEEISEKTLGKLDQYESEGEMYFRKTINVKVKGVDKAAMIYIANLEKLKPYTDRGFDIEDRLDEYLEKTIRNFIKLESLSSKGVDPRPLEENARRELLSLAVDELKQEQITRLSVSPFQIKDTLRKTKIPSLQWLKNDRAAQRYADNYINLALKFMIFNILEEKLRFDFRRSVRAPRNCYQLTLSSLAALIYFNENVNPVLPSISRAMRVHRYNPDLDYIDYAAAASIIAEKSYDYERGREIIDRLNGILKPGAIPLGAEIELSPIGGRAIEAAAGEDALFDSFYYFKNFNLEERMWKLGGHVDNHGFITSARGQVRGFLEFALGRYRILGDISKPSTQCPNCLSALINSLLVFCNIQPHSLHINLEIENPEHLKPLDSPIPYLCLLMIGGDIRLDGDGKLREMRVYSGDIITPKKDLCFSRLNSHHPNLDREIQTFVVEYQFPRLYFNHDYTPLVNALKGFHLSTNPLPLNERTTPHAETQNRELEAYLLEWAAEPTHLSENELNRFLENIECGLSKESKMLAHKEKTFIPNIIENISEQLHVMNQRIIRYHQRETDD